MPGKNKKNKQQHQPVQLEKEEETVPQKEESNVDQIPQTPVQQSSQSESNNNAQKNQQLSEETLTQHSTVTETQNNIQEEHKSQTPTVFTEQPAEQPTTQIPEIVESHKENNNHVETNEKVLSAVEENKQNHEISSESNNKIQNFPMEIKTKEIQKESESIQEPEVTESKFVQPEPIVFNEVSVAQQKIIINEVEPQMLHAQQKPEQPYVEIKQSTESIQPENLQQEQQKVNILKSLHSSEDDQSKIQPKVQQFQNAKQVQTPAVVDNSQSFVEQEIPKTNQNQNGQNTQMFKQRQAGWEKLQQKEVEQILKSPLPVSTSAPQVPQIQPLVKENLQYTNNLPLIQRQRTFEIPQPQAQKSKQDSQKQNKQVSSDNSIKKMIIATVAAGIFAGACVFGKADRRIAAGGSIASFIAAYFVQN